MTIDSQLVIIVNKKFNQLKPNIQSRGRKSVLDAFQLNKKEWKLFDSNL